VVAVTELDDLRREHEEQVVGRRLADLLARIVDATAPTYPPAEYSPAGVWNRAALDDAAQDWTLTRLLERGDLSLMIASAPSMGALRAMLTRSFSQHITNRRRRTSATNLFSRTNKILRADDAFVLVGPSRRAGEQAWTLRTTPAANRVLPDTIDRLIKAASARSDADLGVIRYGPYALKSSPILREAQLRGFLVFLLAEADGALTTAEIFQVMRHRFNLVTLPMAELDDNLPDGQSPVATTVENRLIARSVLARLGYDASHMIRALVDADSDPEGAAQLSGMSIAAMTEAVDRLHALIAEYAQTADDAVAVHRQIIESLYGEDEVQ
jgi:hypothetical protein